MLKSLATRDGDLVCCGSVAGAVGLITSKKVYPLGACGAKSVKGGCTRFHTKTPLFPGPLAECLRHCLPDIGGTLDDAHAGFGERSHLLRRRALAARNDGASVSHPASRRRRLPGNEADDWLLERRLDVR